MLENSDDCQATVLCPHETAGCPTYCRNQWKVPASSVLLSEFQQIALCQNGKYNHIQKLQLEVSLFFSSSTQLDWISVLDSPDLPGVSSRYIITADTDICWKTTASEKRQPTGMDDHHWMTEPLLLIMIYPEMDWKSYPTVMVPN